MESAGIPEMTFRGRVLGALALAAWVAATQAASEAPLELVATIAMPGAKGCIDHLAVDVKGRRLLVAALGNDTVEVLDAAGNLHVRSIPGFGEAQGVLYLPQSNRLYVANGAANRIDILDGASLTSVKRIEKVDDADKRAFRRCGGDGACRVREGCIASIARR